MVVATAAMLYCLFHQTISLSPLPAAFVLRNPVETIFFLNSGEWSQQALTLEQIKPEDSYVELLVVMLTLILKPQRLIDVELSNNYCKLRKTHEVSTSNNGEDVLLR